VTIDGLGLVIGFIVYLEHGILSNYKVKIFFHLPNPCGRTGPWGHLVSNRNEYQKQKSNVSVEQSAAGT
jgi:hypothetical protein